MPALPYELLGTLLIHPVALPHQAKLWMFFPLALSVAVVYRATRARRVRDLPWPTLVTFVNISVGMIAIAAGFYVLHEVVKRYF